MEIKNGKKPLSSKPTTGPKASLDAIFGNPFAIDPDMQRRADEKGLALRFISPARLQQMGGFHERGWRPVKRTELGYDNMGAEIQVFGADPNGYIIRQGMLLAARPKELNEAHKALLKQQAAQQSNALVQKRHAQQLRENVARRGVDVRIDEGYGDDEE